LNFNAAFGSGRAGVCFALRTIDRQRLGTTKAAQRAAFFICDDVRSYWMTISTRRFCGSRTPSAV
jgi:hypothetical protein